MSEFTLADLGVPDERSPEERVGTVVAGCKLERLLGRGGMGTVYLARREADGAHRVVKFLAPEIANNVNLRARFQREWEALRKIGPHPHVVQVHGVHMQGSEPHLVMEYVEGFPLTRILQQHGQMPPADALRFTRDAALGLVAIHGLGLIHRDLKPDNVLIEPSGRAKIVDFGLAKDVFMTSLTLPGQLMGTAIYMAPEQWDDATKEDSRCDLFSLGATLYHLVCGQPPFAGSDLHEISDACQSGDFVPPRELVPDVPEGLEHLLLQLMEPELRYRYGRASDVVSDAERVLAGQPCSAPSLVDAGGRRFVLLGAQRFTIGGQEGCDVHLAHSSVSPRHAQLRREEAGFVLRKVKGSAATLVAGEELTRSRTLSDGDELRLGEAVVTFRDPRASPKASALGEGVRRREVPAPAAEALFRAGDPRATLTALERLAPDPFAAAEAAHVLTPLLGGQVQAVLAVRARLEQGLLLQAGQLHAMTRQAISDPAAWIVWWARARHAAPEQLVAGSPRRRLRLVVQGQAEPAELPLGDRVATLIGRHGSCDLRLTAEGAGRLHLTILRLHRRLVFLDSGQGCTRNGVPAQVGYLEPGDVLEVPGARIRLEAAEVPPERVGEATVVDGLTFWALAELEHPACAQGWVGLLREVQTGGNMALAASDLEAVSAARGMLRSAYVQRARTARQLLPSLLGQDAGSDVAAWTQLLADRRLQLGPQVLPRGWVSATRGTT